jgi:thymidylate synthase (FAD)
LSAYKYFFQPYKELVLSARIIAITQPLINADGEIRGFTSTDSPILTAEEFIAYVARVSNPANQNNKLTAKKLLRYLAKHKHWSPFEHVFITMDISTTRDIARQILRHRSFTFQEFSQRYADVNDLGMMHIREARLQDTKNRQNSIKTDDEELREKWFDIQDEVQYQALEAYKWAIENGIAKEQARVVLPEGMTPSRVYMSGSLRSWIHYCDLRMKNGTQLEHSLIATEAWKHIMFYFPSLEDVLVGE